MGFLTEDSEPFGVDPKVGVHFVSELANSFKDNLGQVLIRFRALCLVIQNVLQSLRYIVAHWALLLNCKQEFLLDEVGFTLGGNVSWQDTEKIQRSTQVYAPGNPFFDIFTQLQRLLQTHLSVGAGCGRTATSITALNLLPDAIADTFRVVNPTQLLRVRFTTVA